MATIPFPPSTSPGDRFTESAGRLINCYAEPLGQGARSSAVIRRAPGLTLFKDTALSVPRGFILVDSDLFVAFDGTLKRVDSAGTVSAVGTLNSDEPAFFARNNKTPTPDIVCVTDSTAYSITTSAVNNFADADLPSPNSVDSLLGFLLFSIADGRCFATGLNAVTVDSSHYITAESNPDGLTRIISWRGEAWLFGPKTTEVWGLPINSTGFPFNRITIIPRGLAGQRAIAGFETGFSEGLLFVGDDNTVHMIRGGYDSQVVSPPWLNGWIEDVSDKSTLNALVYKKRGNAFWQLNAPAWSVVYNITTGTWHERRSYLKAYSDIIYSVNAFGEWIVADQASGKLNYVRSNTFKEGSDPLIFEVESASAAAFPDGFVVDSAFFDFDPGVGEAEGEDPIERDPQVGISWSDDGGASWSTPLLRDLGEQGRYKTQVSVNRCGVAGHQGRRWKLEVSDPVYVGLLQGSMDVRRRAARKRAA